jgi:RecG-like helicase
VFDAPGNPQSFVRRSRSVEGCGPGIAKSLARLNLTRAIDLAYHLPTSTIERVHTPAASGALLGRIVIIPVTPFEIRTGAGRGPTRIFAADADGNTITLTFFNNPGWARKQLPLGEARIVSGRLDAWGDEWQIVHPDVMEPAVASDLPIREPVYPLTEGISNKRMRELALTGLERAPQLAEWDRAVLAWRAALASMARLRLQNPFRIPPQKLPASAWLMTKFSQTSLRYSCFAKLRGASAACRSRAMAGLRRSSTCHTD